MLIIPQWYNDAKEHILKNPDDLNNSYFAPTDITGKQIFVIGMDPEIYDESFCICAGDSVSSESIVKYDVFESEGKNISDDEAVELGAYKRLDEALNVLDQIIHAMENGKQVFRMPK